jgi:hypothetical protein
MMKIVTCILLATLMLGCTSTSRSEFVSVGMPARQAETVLKSAGAKEVQMDMIGETESDIIKSYDLTDGSVLVVAVSKSNDTVARLSVCKNADEPKSKQTWTSIGSVELTKD